MKSFSPALLAAGIAALGLAMAPIVSALASGPRAAGWCGTHPGPAPPAERRGKDGDCPAACHSACARVLRGDADEDEAA